MDRRARIALVLVAAAAVAGIAYWAWRPRADDAPMLSGYIEGDSLYLSAPVAATVTRVAVVEGQRVGAGAALFTMKPDPAVAEQARAAAAVARAEAEAQDLEKGQRPAELSVFDAQRAAAVAQLNEAAAELRRVKVLADKGIFARARLDQAQAAYGTAAADVRAIERQRQVGELGARTDQQRAAQYAAAGARQSLAEASSRLEDLSPRAPSAARVERVFYQPGEWAAANQPVVALLPDDQVKVRFFVGEGAMALYRPGRTVRFSCDGCASGLTAVISYVSPRPQFTPPVIYSRKTRDKLVFLVEARPARPAGLAPGQPVDVEPLTARASS